MTIRNTLYSAFGTRQVSTIYTATNDYEVILEVDPKHQQDANALAEHLSCAAAAGSWCR